MKQHPQHPFLLRWFKGLFENVRNPIPRKVEIPFITTSKPTDMPTPVAKPVEPIKVTSPIVPTTHPPSALVVEALKVAKSQLGVTEEKGNKGPMIKTYLGSVDLGEGYAWCAAFVYWCMAQASRTLSIPNPAVKTAGVLNHYNKTKGIKVKMPRPGDIFIMEFKAGLGHTGFVKTVDPVKKTFTTIEGNSDASGSRTGGMVCTNTRDISKIKGFIRY